MERWETMSCPFNRCNYGSPCKHFYRRQRQRVSRDKPKGSTERQRVEGSDLVAQLPPSTKPSTEQALLADYGLARHPSLIARAQRYRKYIAEKQKRKAKRF